MFLLFLSAAAGAQVPTGGLVAYYPFNNSASDESGNLNHGKLNGAVAPADDRFGNPCGAYRFMGTGCYVSVPNSVSLKAPSSSLAITAWVKPEKGSNSSNDLSLILLSKPGIENGSDVKPQYCFQIKRTFGDSYSTITLSNDFSFQDKQYNNHPMEFGQWYFIAITYDENFVQVYQDGKLIAQAPKNRPFSPNDFALEIGRDIAAGKKYFNGSLDDLRIYSRGLSFQEVNALYKDGSAKLAKEEVIVNFPKSVQKNTAPGTCSAKVFYNEPEATIGFGSVVMKQLSGLHSGSDFAAGRNNLVYEATVGDKKIVDSFQITVLDNEPPVFTCVTDVIAKARTNTSGVEVDYPGLSVTDNCPNLKLELLEGLPTGGVFPKGTTSVKYEATDAAGNKSYCSFKVTVIEDAQAVKEEAKPHVNYIPEETRKSPAVVYEPELLIRPVEEKKDLAKEQAERERLAAAKELAEKERLAKEKAAADAAAKEAAERARLAREQAERERLEKEKAVARELAESERIANEKALAEKQRLAEEKAAADAEARDAAERERLVKVQEEKEHLDKVKAEAKEQAERQRLATEKALAEKQRLAEEKAAADAEAKDAAERERIATEKALAEKQRLAEEKAAADALAKEAAEKERMAKLIAEKELLDKAKAKSIAEAKEAAEKERLEKVLAEKERLQKERAAAKEAAEKERLAKEKAIEEKDQLERALADKERLVKEKAAAEDAAEKERLEKEKAIAEKERLEKLLAEKERLDKVKVDVEKMRVAKEKAIARDAEPPHIACPKDTVILLPPNRKGLIYYYKQPVVTDNVGVDSMIMKAGPKDGCFLTEGVHPFIFEAYDRAGNTQTCTYSLMIKKDISVAPYAPPQQLEADLQLGSDSVHYEHKATLSNCELTVLIYDDGEQDNDSVSIIFNGHVLVNRQMIRIKENGAIRKNITLMPDAENYIIAKAWNTGRYGLNTLRIDVYESLPEGSKGDLKLKKPLMSKILHSRPGDAGGLLLQCN